MWTLFIISSVIDSTEPKVTRYAEFEHFYSCFNEQAILHEEMQMGEQAICILVGTEKASIDRVY